MNQVLRVSRQERKYLISLRDRLYLLGALQKILVPDAYGGYDGYRVRSVYFDGIDNQDCIGKMKKNEFVKRIRIRIYSTTDTTAKFEIKRKLCGFQVKDSIVIQKEEALKILEGDFSPLLSYDDPTAELGYELGTTMGYRPISMVEYARRAFTHPCFNTRITLDNHLQYSNFETDLFSDDPNYRYAMPLRKTILEVKFEDYLMDPIQFALNKCNLERCKVSKFGSSRSLLNEYYY